MEFTDTNKLHRKSGGMGHPSLVRERERRGGVLGLPYFVTGIECDTGQR